MPPEANRAWLHSPWLAVLAALLTVGSYIVGGRLVDARLRDDIRAGDATLESTLDATLESTKVSR